MITLSDDRLIRQRKNAGRGGRLRSTMRPGLSANARSETAFARSIATVVACMAADAWEAAHIIIQADPASRRRPRACATQARVRHATAGLHNASLKPFLTIGHFQL